jgi:hypothetical protein
MGVFDPRPSFRGVTGTERMATAMDMPFSFGQAFGENFSQGITDSFGLGTAIRELTTPSLLSDRPFRGETPENYEARRGRFETQSLSEDEYKTSPFFREAVPYQPGMTPDRAAALAKSADTRAVRQYFSQKQPIAAFLGQFGGQALDPINYVPVFGQGAQLAAVARFGSIGGRALMSASEAAINTAAFGILTAGVRSRLGDDVSFEMIGTEIAMSALIGGAFGGGIGMLVRGRDARERVALGQARNALSTAANRQKAAIALNEQIDALATTGNPAATPNGMASIETVHTEVQRRVTAARSLDEQTAGVTGTKAGEVVIAPSGRRVSVVPEVVELDSLIHAEGALQVRNRRTAASDAQIEEIGATLDPARMMPNIDGSQGAPLVGADHIIDSGNGRVAGVRRAYEAYPEKAEAYRAFLAEQGYNVEGMQRPVLINRRVTNLDETARAQFNAELNGRTTASLGAVEIAQMDRAAMTDNVLDAHAPAPVTAASNRAFVQRFMAQLPANDRQALLSADGKGLSAEGVRRIENALFASAYGDIDPSAVRRFAEGVDDNTRSIVGAMSDMAGAWAKMRRDAKAGMIPQHLDQTKELTDALRLIGMWREQAVREGRPVAKVISEGMAQMDLLTGEISPETQVFVRSFYTSGAFTRAQGREALASQFADLIESGYELGRPSLFGDAMPEVSALQVLENAVRRNAETDLRPTGDALSRAEENGSADIEPAAGADRGLDRQGAEAGAEALAEADIFSQDIFKSAVEADAAELLRLAEIGDIEAIKASPALARVTAEMQARPATDTVAGYGSQAWMDGREYVGEDGTKIEGVEAAQDYLLDNARNLAAKELGIERFDIAAERKAVIVIGPPAAGKSTIANQVALRLKAAIPDPDEAKKLMPEYDGGIGSNATHEESSFLTRYVMEELMDAGENMVIPKVGDSAKSIERLGADLKEAGYTVDVMLMDVAPAEAFRRMIVRFVKTGRLIPPGYFDEVAQAPARVYEELKTTGAMDGYAKVDSPRGIQPRVSESSLKTADYAAGDEIAIGGGRGNGSPDGRGSEGGAPGAAAQSLIPNSTKPAPDPVPEGLDAAAQAVGKPVDPLRLGESYGLDAQGGFAEEADIAALKANKMLTPEDQAMLDEADQLVADAEAYGQTLDTAAWCMR